LIVYESERCWVVDVGRRIAEDNAVEEVKELRPEFQIPQLALQVEFLEQGEIFTVGGRRTHAGKAWGRIAKGERIRLAKGVDVEVHIFRRVETAHGYRAPSFGGEPVGTVAPAEQRNVSAAVHWHGRGKSCRSETR